MNVTKKILALLISAVILFCVFPIGVFAENEDDVVENPEIPADAMIYKGHSYRVYTDSSIGWHDAQAFCEKLGGHLATITNAGEDDFIYSLVADYGISCWLGATDEETEGEWKWVTGEAWDYSNASFDNCRDLQHYLTINHHGSVWDDQSEKETSDNGALCDTGGFICEWETVSDIQLSYFERILGVYEGSYTATQGITGLTLSIYRTQELLSDNLLLQKYADVANSCSVSSDENVAIFNVEDVKAIVSQHNEEYIALFNFFPIVDDTTGEAPNPDVEEGLYTMTISYDATTGTYEFIGNQWIQHDTYAMADLKNITFTDNTLSGDVYGEYASWFWTEYGDVGDVSVCRGDLLSGYRIDFECESTSLRIDEAQQIKAFVKNNQGVLAEDVADIMWFSKDESIAKITGENWGGNNFEYSVGTILGVSEGETEIYAKLGNNRIAVCTVSVKDKITIKGRAFDKNIDYYTANCDSSEYNPTLANMLAALSAVAYDEDEITAAYEKLGFLDDFSTHYYSIGNFDPNFCSYTIGFKDSEYNNEKVCLITVRGSDSFSDWVYNFDIFTAEEKHQGFFAPALVICQKIGEILIDNGILPNDVKYVITGHSRGAAVGNLLAVELMEQGINAENVYNYNYACPDVACKVDFPIYDNIFNLCNTDDLVAFVPGAICNSFVTQGTSWDKYGQTYWFTKDVDGFFASHAMDLYLEFFDRQLNVFDWPFEIESMASGVLTKVLCPVDVIITDENGNSIASVINGEINYSDNNDSEIIIFTDGDKKIIYHNGDANFYVSLIGTDDGTMTFSIEKCNLATGEVTESKTFNNVVLEDGKTMYCSVDATTEINDVSLFVVEEKNGEIIYTHTIGTDGTETVIPCEHTWNDGEITKQPTHTDFGETTFNCDDCGATKTEQIEKTSVHTYGNWVKVDDTTHKHTCECGENETENHLFGDWVITKESSESETGAKEKSCVCGYAVTEEIPKKVVETDPSKPSTDGNDSNESESSNTLGENNDASIFGMLENIPKETIIIGGASIAGVILLVVICAIFKKKRS